MDIYNYFNSKDIADYNRGIAHSFSPIEKAYIIFHSRNHSFSEKHKAWLKLIAETNDCEVKECIGNSYFESLHEVLRKNIEIDNKRLERFFNNDNNAIYSYYIVDKGEPILKKGLYDSVDKIKEIILEENKDFSKVFILKRIPNQRNECMKVAFYSNWEPYYLIGANNLINEYRKALSGLWFYVPTPFVRGDILKYFHGLNNNQTIIQLDEICYWNMSKRELNEYLNGERGTSNNMNAYGYEITHKGIEYRDTCSHYWDLEYCNVDEYIMADKKFSQSVA